MIFETAPFRRRDARRPEWSGTRVGGLFLRQPHGCSRLIRARSAVGVAVRNSLNRHHDFSRHLLVCKPVLAPRLGLLHDHREPDQQRQSDHQSGGAKDD